jgi:hypothetical protein
LETGQRVKSVKVEEEEGGEEEEEIIYNVTKSPLQLILYSVYSCADGSIES